MIQHCERRIQFSVTRYIRKELNHFRWKPRYERCRTLSMANMAGGGHSIPSRCLRDIMDPFTALNRRAAATTKMIPRVIESCFSTTTQPRLVISSNSNYVDASVAPADFTRVSAVVYPCFATDEEAQWMVKDIRSRIRRRRYEKGHWDAVITNYKEVELFDEMTLSPVSRGLLERVRGHLSEKHLSPIDKHGGDDPVWLPCHAIELRKDGELRSHVDSVRFSGDLVAGLSFQSSGIMRLVPSTPDDENEIEVDRASSSSSSSSDAGSLIKSDPTTSLLSGEQPSSSGWVDLYLPPLSLYVLTGVSRYKYTHELLPAESEYRLSNKNLSIQREDRISVIFRDAKSSESIKD